MLRVGTTRLRSQLRRCLDSVRKGERILVTDRGTPVAEIVPIGAAADESLEARLAALAAQGLLTFRAKPQKARQVRAVRLAEPVSAADVVSRLRDE